MTPKTIYGLTMVAVKIKIWILFHSISTKTGNWAFLEHEYLLKFKKKNSNRRNWGKCDLLHSPWLNRFEFLINMFHNFEFHKFCALIVSFISPRTSFTSTSEQPSRSKNVLKFMTRRIHILAWNKAPITSRTFILKIIRKIFKVYAIFMCASTCTRIACQNVKPLCVLSLKSLLKFWHDVIIFLNKQAA